MTVPTNIPDLDSYIVADAIAWQERRASGKFIVYPSADDIIDQSVQQVLDDADLIRDDNVSNLVLDAVDDYTSAYNSGSERRAVLFKLFADLKEVMPALTQKIDWSAELEKALNTIIISDGSDDSAKDLLRKSPSKYFKQRNYTSTQKV